jgi:hypothetical protein
VKRVLATGCLLAISTFSAYAILDTNDNELSDVWERAYNNGQLFGPSFDPQADADGDGWTNSQEAAAGTNPFDPNPPDGYLRPDIVHVPAVWSDTDFDEIPDTISTPEAFTITWTTIPGKQYTLLYSLDLIEWLALEPAFIGNGSVVVYGYDLTEDDKFFWRVKIEDVDSDGDGLTDAEESQLGTNPSSRDSDGDGVSDWDELMINSTNPLSAIDADNDGIPDDLEKHMALQLLAYQPDPGPWGAYYAGLVVGDLDATHDYTGDGMPAIELAAILTGIPAAMPSQSDFLMEQQIRRNKLEWAYYMPVTSNNPTEYAVGSYWQSNPTSYGDRTDLNSLADFAPSYLVTHIDAVQWGESYVPSMATWVSGLAGYFSGGASGFLVTPEWSPGVSFYEGFIQQERFRVIAKRANHPSLNEQYLKITSKRDYYTSGIGEVLAVEPLVIGLPKGRFSTEWIDLKAPMTAGQDTVVTLVPIEIVVPKVSADGNPVPGIMVSAVELKVSKMQKSLTVEKNAGVITKEELNIDDDIDRFYVRIVGGAVMLQNNEVATVNVSTSGCLDLTYNDDETEVVLQSVGADLISPSMILVSDTVDDDHAGPVDVGGDDVQNDRTHIVQLGGKINVSKLVIGNVEHTINLQKEVLKKKRVSINIVILDDGNVNVPDMTATADRDIKAANERYAQAGVEIVKGSLTVKPLPTDLSLPGNKLIIEESGTGPASLTEDVKRIIDVYGTTNNLDDIHVFYVPMGIQALPGTEIDGVGLNHRYEQLNANYRYNVFIKKMTYPSGLAHELGHILTDGAHLTELDLTETPDSGKAPTNLMFDIVNYELKIRDTKRLLDRQEKVIHASRHSTPVTP